MRMIASVRDGPSGLHFLPRLSLTAKKANRLESWAESGREFGKRGGEGGIALARYFGTKTGSITWRIDAFMLINFYLIKPAH